MTVFLTPDGRAVLRRHVLPARAAPRAAELPPGARRASPRRWRERRDDVARPAAQLVEAVRAARAARAVDASRSRRRCSPTPRAGSRAAFDPEWGGFGGAPKFPPALDARVPAAPHADGDEERSRWRPTTLDGMALGGMYDLVGGGFHRYSVDERWLVPHFEKMLYDNALLVPAYLHGWLVTGKERYREIVEETLDYMLRELRARGRRLRLGAGRRHRRRRGADVHVDGGGGRAGASSSQPFEHGRSIAPRRARRRAARAALLEVREPRPQPLRDDKAIASWNGLALAALAEAGRRLDRAGLGRRGARSLGEFLLGAAVDADGRLQRSYRDGRTSGDRATSTTTRTSRTASTSCTSRPASCAGSRRRTGSRGSPSSSSRDEERGGFFLAAARRRAARRAQEGRSTTTRLPSGNSMLAYVLLRLARIYGDDELERRAVSVLPARCAPRSRARRRAFGWALCALDLHFAPPRELAIVGAGRRRRRARGARSRCEPDTVVAFGPADARAAAGRQGPRRRPDRGLRLRALRLPGAGHRREVFTTLNH